MAAADPHPILRVGDRPLVAGHGRKKIEAITVCLTPTTDPAGEQHGVDVDRVELGEFGPPFAVTLEGGSWAYGIHVSPEDIEKGAEHEG